MREDVEEHLQRHGRSLFEEERHTESGEGEGEGAGGAKGEDQGDAGAAGKGEDMKSPPSRKRARRSPGGSSLSTPHKRRDCVALRPKNYKGGRVPFSRLEEYYVLRGYEKHRGAVRARRARRCGAVAMRRCPSTPVV